MYLRVEQVAASGGYMMACVLQPYVSQAATLCIRGGGDLLDADGELHPLLLEALQLRRGETWFR